MAAGLAWGKRTSRKSRLVVADCGAAALICTVALVPLASLRTSAPKVLVIAVVVAAGTTVAWRRAAPYSATFVALGSLVAYQRLTRQAITDIPPFAVVLTTYTASTLGISRREMSRLVCLLALSSAAVVLVASNSPGFSIATVVEAALPAVVAPAAAGLLVAWRRSVARRLRLTRALLEDEQELRVARAATDERHRLARELHDVVAHAVSVMVIHAGVARLTILDDPAAAAVPLGRIITSGREALVDLRRMIGRVCHDDQKESGSPPTISRLSELVQEVSRVGLATDLVVEGARGRLTEHVGQVLYRVAQEALTNAIKHSGGGSAVVAVHVGDDTADVRIINRASGRTAPPQRLDGAGRGLVGMAERVAHHGGTLRAGELSDGAFEVWARVPLLRDDDELSARRWPRASRIARLWFAMGHRRPVMFAAATLVALELDAVLSATRRGSLAENMVIVAAMAVVTLQRRHHPLVVCVAINALAIPLSGGLADITRATVVSTFVFVVPVYSVAAWASVRPAVVGATVTVAAIVGAGIWHHAPTSALLANSGLTIALWAVGRLVRQQRNLATSLEQASTALLAERTERQRVAVSAERDRIVRDLQASVTQEVTAMVVVAQTLLGDSSTEPGDKAHIVASIEDSGRSALAQMRHILGALRSEHEADERRALQPTPA